MGKIKPAQNRSFLTDRTQAFLEMYRAGDFPVKQTTNLGGENARVVEQLAKAHGLTFLDLLVESGSEDGKRCFEVKEDETQAGKEANIVLVLYDQTPWEGVYTYQDIMQSHRRLENFYTSAASVVDKIFAGKSTGTYRGVEPHESKGLVIDLEGSILKRTFLKDGLSQAVLEELKSKGKPVEFVAPQNLLIEDAVNKGLHEVARANYIGKGFPNELLEARYGPLHEHEAKKITAALGAGNKTVLMIEEPPAYTLDTFRNIATENGYGIAVLAPIVEKKS